MHYPTRRPLPTLEDRIVAHLAKAPATRSQLCEALDTSRTNLGRALLEREVVAVELAHDVLAPAFDLSAARQVHDRAAVLHERGVQARDVEARGRQIDEGDECVGATHG